MSMGVSVLQNQKVKQRHRSALRFMVLNPDRIMNLAMDSLIATKWPASSKKKLRETFELRDLVQHGGEKEPSSEATN